MSGNLSAVQRRKSIIDTKGYDPADDSWVEELLANGVKELAWFRFVREKSLPKHTQELIEEFKKLYSIEITMNESVELSKKRMRYLMGAAKSRWQDDSTQTTWISSAKEFESKHRAIEERMKAWTESRKGDYPFVVNKLPLRFWAGQWMQQCLIKIPELFADTTCSHIKEGILLKVYGYDPETKHIDIDFSDEIRNRLVGKLARKSEDWYVIFSHPSSIKEELDGLDSLIEQVN